jgi:hypothetical protein
MRPERVFRPIAPGAIALLISVIGLQADFLDDVNRALLFGDDGPFRLRLSGLADLEAYYFEGPPPALIESDSSFLLNPRLSIFADAQLGSHLYASAQIRVDRGFDPADGGANVRADEYFLRIRPFDSALLNVQIGKFGTVVGNWVPRHYSWENPFINAPLPYENLTGIWDIAAPDSVDTLLSWAHVGAYDSGDYSDKYLRLPVIWGPSYASGISIFGAIDKFDYAVELKNSALSSRPESWDVTQVGFTHPTFSGRIGARPNEMWTFGLSASAGPYLLASAGPTLPPGRGISDYRELVLGQDVSFAWRHLQLWAEFYETRFEVPQIGNANTFAYYIEGKYKLSPQLFAALRWNEQLFGTVRDGGDEVQWGNDVWRIDAVLGYRFTNYLQTKLQYSFTDDDTRTAHHLIATQVTLKF